MSAQLVWLSVLRESSKNKQLERRRLLLRGYVKFNRSLLQLRLLESCLLCSEALGELTLAQPLPVTLKAATALRPLGDVTLKRLRVGQLNWGLVRAFPHLLKGRLASNLQHKALS